MGYERETGTEQGGEIRLDVAGVGLALQGEGAHRAVLRGERYRPFLGSLPPAATVEVTTAEVNRDRTFTAPEVALAGRTLTYHSAGVEGYLDAAGGRGWLRLTADEDLAVMAVANFLRSAYALLLVDHGGFLFHSAGMIRHGRGYLFYGHSGSGKTTVSRLSRGTATLLSDDLVAVRAHSGVWHAHGTPFWGELGDHPKTSARAPLRAIFGLVKDRDVRAEPLSAALAVADLVSSVPVTSTEAPVSQRLIGLCADLATRVPCYHLHFTPDDSFWRVVDELD